jgi:hypothetical protein
MDTSGCIIYKNGLLAIRKIVLRKVTLHRLLGKKTLVGNIISTYVIPYFATYVTPLIPPIGPLIPIFVVLLGYFFGKSVYFRQKEYELIT